MYHQPMLGQDNLTTTKVLAAIASLKSDPDRDHVFEMVDDMLGVTRMRCALRSGKTTMTVTPGCNSFCRVIAVHASCPNPIRVEEWRGGIVKDHEIPIVIPEHPETFIEVDDTDAVFANICPFEIAVECDDATLMEWYLVSRCSSFGDVVRYLANDVTPKDR